MAKMLNVFNKIIGDKEADEERRELLWIVWKLAWTASNCNSHRTHVYIKPEDEMLANEILGYSDPKKRIRRLFNPK